MNVYKQIYKKIKRSPVIVIARHKGPDPDALCSSIGLKEIILKTFPSKKVYVIGAPAKKFRYLGVLDKYDDSMKNALLIVTDTPDRNRVDGVDPLEFTNSIKIDHHPFMEKTCNLEWIDDKSSSACQMILELVFNTRLKLTPSAASKLFIGIVSDTNRFMFKYSSAKTFYLVSKLLDMYDIDITSLYEKMYMRPYKEIKFSGFISQNFVITEHNVGYIIIDDGVLEEYGVDSATPGNMINDYNYISEMVVWCTFTHDKENGNYRGSIRSRGVVINDVVQNYGGGGHMYASGVKIKDPDDIMLLVGDLDKRVESTFSS